MRPLHAIALASIPFLTVAGAWAATWHPRVRDAFFFAMVTLAVLAERMDVNFFSEAWYRGTTRGVQFTLVEMLAFGLLAYAVISVVVSEPKMFGAFELSKMAGSILVFVSAAAYVRSRREWKLLLVAGAFAGWSRPLRWFCGACAALGAVGLLLTFSRAGIPVFFAVVSGTILACASWRPSPRWISVRVLVAAVCAVLVASLWSQIEGRYAGATLEEEYFDPTVDGRGIYLRLAQAIASDHFFWVGLNNWSYEVSRTYGPRLGFRFTDYGNLVSVYGSQDDKLFADSYLAAPAHNLAALTLGELGVPGLVLFAFLWLRWFGMGAAFLRLPRGEQMRTMGVGIFFCTCGIFGQTLTEWVYRQTPLQYTFYLLLGTLASLSAARRRALDQKGPDALIPAARPPVLAEIPVGEGV